MEYSQKVKLLMKLIFALIWTIVLPVCYANSRRKYTCYSTKYGTLVEEWCFTSYMVAAAIYLTSNAVNVVLYLVPAFSKYIEVSNNKICKVLSWWTQVPRLDYCFNLLITWTCYYCSMPIPRHNLSDITMLSVLSCGIGSVWCFSFSKNVWYTDLYLYVIFISGFKCLNLSVTFIYHVHPPNEKFRFSNILLLMFWLYFFVNLDFTAVCLLYQLIFSFFVLS